MKAASIDPVEVLRLEVALAGDQRSFAQAHGISPQHVSDVLRGQRRPGPRILGILGLTKVITYQRTRSS